MINKQNLWFLTLFTLILVLSIYYITMPNDLLTKANNTSISEKNKTKKTIEDASSLTAMRVNLDEERETEKTELQKQLTDEDMSSQEKNNAYEKLKYLNEVKGKEETYEKNIKKQYKLDCFVKMDNSNVSVVCVSNKHDNALANNIMRLIQKDNNEKLYITVKFQKS
ncbi:MAG: SpoIIIAH-like family protein [Bacilli bacterium]|nr:SpoIIIAH-like family protein [Bacilli bacterium]